MMMSTFLSEKVEQSLGNKDYTQLLEDVFNPEFYPYIQHEGMDLITKICENGIAFANDDDSIEACTKCLDHVVKNYKPKEALVALLEQGEVLVHSDKFKCVLVPLQHVMLNLPKKREKTFSWVLSILKSHVKYHCQVPEGLSQLVDEKEDQVLLEQDPQVKYILQIYKDFIKFYTPFVEQWKTNYEVAINIDINSNDMESVDMESIHRQREYLRDYMVDLLGVPLIHFDLAWDDVGNGAATDATTSKKLFKTEARIIAEDLMKLLSIVDYSPLDYVQWIEKRMKLVSEPKDIKRRKPEISSFGTMDLDAFSDDEDEEEVIVHMSSLVNYFYLVLDQNLPVQKFAGVYSPTYLFNTMLYPVCTVLKNEGNFIALKKAIRLMAKILSFCDTAPSSNGDINYSHRLDRNLLKTDIHGVFIDRITFIAVYCMNAAVRKEAYLLFRQYWMTFDPFGKYDLFLFVLNTIPSDTLIGHMITEVIPFIIIALDEQHPAFEKGMEQCFLGTSAARLISSVCQLKDGVTTDVSQHSHQIIAALNLLRFCLLRDKEEKKVGILNFFQKIEDSMLNPLRKGLDLSRAHFELRLKELNDPHLQKDREIEEKKMFDNLKCDIKIGGKDVKAGDISIQEQKDNIMSSIGTFDHMTGLLAWVYDAHSSCSK